MPSPSPPSLVVLAAGRGTRFGGPKQLVAVRDDGATITDVAIERAAAAGIDHVVVVVSEVVESAVRSRLDPRTGRGVPSPARVTVVRQDGTRGTAQALLAARDVTDGPVVVVNADDIYPADTYAAAAAHLATGPTAGHAVLGFPVSATLYGPRPQSRALLEVVDGRLVGIREGQVAVGGDGTVTFVPKDPAPAPTGAVGAAPAGAVEVLRGDEPVSMNAMVLQRDVFARLAEALDETDADEVYLPDVVADLVADGVTVTVLRCAGRCHGLTYAEDVGTLHGLL